MSSSRPPRPARAARGARWREWLGRLRRRLLQRLVLIAGGLTLLRLNAAAGGLLGFSAPVSPEAITIDFARVLAAALGLWMVYRGLR